MIIKSYLHIIGIKAQSDEELEQVSDTLHDVEVEFYDGMPQAEVSEFSFSVILPIKLEPNESDKTLKDKREAKWGTRFPAIGAGHIVRGNILVYTLCTFDAIPHKVFGAFKAMFPRLEIKILSEKRGLRGYNIKIQDVLQQF